MPEWQLAPVDEEPPDEAPSPLDAAGPNIALARLAAKKAEDNLISLTNDMGGGGRPRRQQQNNTAAAAPDKAKRNSGGGNRGSVDMDLEDDDDDEDNGSGAPGGIPLPGEFTEPPPAVPSNGHGGGRRPSLQDRLRNLAGQPANSEEAAKTAESPHLPSTPGLEEAPNNHRLLHQRPPPLTPEMQGPPPMPLVSQMQVPPPQLAGPPPPMFGRGGPPPQQQPMRGRGGRPLFPRVIRGVDRGRGGDRGGRGGGGGGGDDDQQGGFRGRLAGPFSPGFKGDPSLGLRGLPPEDGGPMRGGLPRGRTSRGGPPRARGGQLRGGPPRGGRGRGRW